jgi:hypothetical protein
MKKFLALYFFSVSVHLPFLGRFAVDGKSTAIKAALSFELSRICSVCA